MKVRDTRRRPKSKILRHTFCAMCTSFSIYVVTLKAEWNRMPRHLRSSGAHKFNSPTDNNNNNNSTHCMARLQDSFIRLMVMCGGTMQSMPGAVDTLKSNPSKNKLKCVSVSIIINIIENASTMKRASPPPSATHTPWCVVEQTTISMARGRWKGALFLSHKQIVIGFTLPQCDWDHVRRWICANRIHLNV